MALKLSTRGRYGMRALCCLASNDNGKPLSIQTISDAEKIPLRYLEQIMSRLRRGGIVKSIRGPKGGYELCKKPFEISLDLILQVLEGSLAIVWCADTGKKRRCTRENHCFTKGFWNLLNRGITDVLKQVTLADLASNDWEHKMLTISFADQKTNHSGESDDK